jgi:hypothetical protein
VTWQEYEKHTLKNILKMLTHMQKLVNTWEVSTFEKVKERTCWATEQVMVVGPSSQVVGTLVSQNLLNYDGPHIPVIVITTSDSHTYVPHNLKGLLSSEQDPITGVLQYYNSLFKIPSE